MKLERNTDATKRGKQPVTGAVAGAVGRRVVVDAVGDHHVEPVLEQPLDHRHGARRVVGGVAIHQHVDIGLHVGKHAPHHVAFALALFPVNLGAGRARRSGGIVGRIVVEDEDRGSRQRGAEVPDHLGDRHLFVVARHQHGDRILAEVAGFVRRRLKDLFRQSVPPCPSRAPHCGEPAI